MQLISQFLDGPLDRKTVVLLATVAFVSVALLTVAVVSWRERNYAKRKRSAGYRTVVKTEVPRLRL